MPTATNTSPVPIQPIQLSIRFSMSNLKWLAAPAFAVDRLRSKKQAERDEAQVIDDVRRVDDALREVVEVLDDRQIRRDLLDRRSREAADPVDHPQEQEHGEGAHHRDDLVLRQARDEEAERDEAAAHQQQAEI